jgi:hypothetical protein
MVEHLIGLRSHALGALLSRCLEGALRGWAKRSRLTVALVWTILWGVTASGRAEQPSLSVLAQVPESRYYAGQAIELRVAVEAGSEAPKVTPPRVADADVAFFRLDPLQRGSTAIGNLVSERILYVFRFRVVARRPGALVIPPVAARLGDRAGRSAEVRVQVEALPSEGRPATFLGGVGSLDAGAEAWPTSLRAGETLEYRLRLQGPGARGSLHPPDLKPLSRLGLEVEPLPTEYVSDPPSRVFRFRIRPRNAGTTVLPPVAISYFDPKAGRYLTKTAPGVPIRVVQVAGFDPGTLQYDPVPGAAGSRQSWVLAASLALAALAIALLARPAARRCLRVWNGLLARIEANPSRFALRAARRLENPGTDLQSLAARIAADLARYLLLACGRPAGALTPLEASEAVDRLTADPALAACAARVLATCDHARFSGQAVASVPLAHEAMTLFRALAARQPDGSNADLELKNAPRLHSRSQQI